MKTILGLLLLISATSAFANCDIRTFSRARHAMRFNFTPTPYHYETDTLRECIQLAKDKLGSSYTGSVQIIPSPTNNTDSIYNENGEFVIFRVSYRYYNPLSGIEHTGSLRR